MVQPVLDWRLTVKKLNGDEKAAREIITMFLNELPNLHRLVNQACKSNDAKKLYEHLHRLHGGCCYVGVPGLKTITYQFCDAAKHQQFHRFAILLTDFNLAVDAVKIAAKDLVLP
jgi:HPt (histidine-containing phosphotransfer) domain-containing protein